MFPAGLFLITVCVRVQSTHPHHLELLGRVSSSVYRAQHICWCCQLRFTRPHPRRKEAQTSHGICCCCYEWSLSLCSIWITPFPLWKFKKVPSFIIIIPFSLHAHVLIGFFVCVIYRSPIMPRSSLQEETKTVENDHDPLGMNKDHHLAANSKDQPRKKKNRKQKRLLLSDPLGMYKDGPKSIPICCWATWKMREPVPLPKAACHLFYFFLFSFLFWVVADVYAR